MAGTALSFYSLWRLLRADELRSYRFFAVTSLGLHSMSSSWPPQGTRTTWTGWTGLSPQPVHWAAATQA